MASTIGGDGRGRRERDRRSQHRDRAPGPASRSSPAARRRSRATRSGSPPRATRRSPTTSGSTCGARSMSRSAERHPARATSSPATRAATGAAPGIQTTGFGTVLEGNTIGLDAAGDAFDNDSGIVIGVHAENTRIGGTAPGARNIIAGHGNPLSFTSFGLLIGQDSTSTTVQGNYIGLAADGIDGQAQHDRHPGRQHGRGADRWHRSRRRERRSARTCAAGSSSTAARRPASSSRAT